MRVLKVVTMCCHLNFQGDVEHSMLREIYFTGVEAALNCICEWNSRERSRWIYTPRETEWIELDGTYPVSDSGQVLVSPSLKERG